MLKIRKCFSIAIITFVVMAIASVGIAASDEYTSKRFILECNACGLGPTPDLIKEEVYDKTGHVVDVYIYCDFWPACSHN
jgi:hypothetical protein